MTYPHPSERHQELVCTAGITDDFQWVRLYPIDYRYQPQNRQFRKYQWIEIGLTAKGAKNDGRKESRRPDLESIQILREPLTKDYGWRSRREIIDHMPHHTRLELEALYEAEKVSLGIVRPTEILDLKVEPVERQWKPEWEATLRQFNLFSGSPKTAQRHD